MQNIELFQEITHSPCKVAIIPHHHPDADALGSCLALSHFLNKEGHQTRVISPSSFPGFLTWMPGSESVWIYEAENVKLIDQFILEADILFCLDFSAYNRLMELEPVFRKASGHVGLIDHHLNPEMESDFKFWNIKASSTCELVYDFIEMLGKKSFIDIQIGECLYAGIVTDTSSFKHPTTTKRVHLIAAELIDLGVNTNRVQRLIYDNSTESRLRFLGYALQEKLTVLSEYHTAYFKITAGELEQFHNQLGDTEGLVNYALSIKDIAFAATIIEKSGRVKLSFRSVGDFAVNDFAHSHFSGGGHKNASGGISALDIEETEKLFLKLLREYKDKLEQAIK
ncbi:MAG: DHH family phosphoesterase [Microscillaceae bacterium]|nr:DHH family phosphoesterase [Microscillaceae bacterium]